MRSSRLGGRARPGPRRRAGQPRRPAVPRAGRRPRATSSTGSASSADDGHVWPIFNLADSAIVCGAVLAAAPRAVRRRHRRPPQQRAGGRAVSETRLLPVPDGLDGLRLDVAISRLLRLLPHRAPPTSSTPAASASTARCRRAAPRCTAARWLEVTLPRPGRGAPAAPSPSTGCVVLYDDDDVVVVDKPVGVAAHPSPGWTGPTVIGGLAAMGYRIVDHGRGRAAGRRAPPGRRHHRRHGRRQERARVHAAQARVQGAHRRQALQRPRAGPPRPDHAAPSTRRSTGTRAPTTSSPSWPAAGRASRTTRRSRRSGPRRCSTSTSRPAAPTRSGCTWPRCATPCVGDLTYGADPTLARAARPDPAVAARPRARVRAPVHR